MRKIDELNEAMEVIKDECCSHDSCSECPFYLETAYKVCILDNSPDNWKKVEE